jgi:hypothetical protein
MLAALLVGSGAQAGVCPPSPSSIDARGGLIAVCSTEPTTAVQLQRNGVTTKAIPMVLRPGQIDALKLTICGSRVSMRSRGINGTQVTPWSRALRVTLPQCK